MTLRMYCVADWVNYHLYDYEDAPLMAWWRQWAAEGGYRRA